MFLRVLFVIIGLLVSGSNFAQLSFKAVANKSKLGINQRLRVSYELNQQGADNFQVSDFPNFTIISGPSTSVSQSWVNGKSSFSKKYNYIIQPKKTGTFTIAPATIDYEGKQYKSNTITIVVSDKVEEPEDPNDPAYIVKNGVHLVTEVSKSKPYVGEAVYVKYKLYVKNTIGVNDVKLKGIPQYPGFWNQQMNSGNQRFVRSSYKGQDDYYALDIYKVLLIPQKSGKLEIAPSEISLALGIPTGRGDFFGNMISTGYRHVASSPKRTVKVKELPEEGKPVDFSGAVGQFSFKVLRSNSLLKANEASEIKVVVSGTGNFKLFELPKIAFPSDIEVFTPEKSEQLTTTYLGLKGTISESYTIVPQYKGKYRIPSISFSYFNPKTGKYQTLQKDDMFIEALEGSERPQNLTIQTSTEAKNTITNKEKFRFIALKTKLKSKNNDVDFFQSILYYLWVSILLLSFPVLIALKRRLVKRAMDISGKRLKKANKLAKKFLREAKESMDNHEKFYVALEKALHNFLKAKLKIETSDIAKEKIMQLLLDKNIPNADAKSFVEVLERCDFARYAPSTQVMVEKEYNEAVRVIVKIDKYL